MSETDSVIEAFYKEFEAAVECLLMAAGAPYSMWSLIELAYQMDGQMGRMRINEGMDVITTELWFRGVVKRSI